MAQAISARVLILDPSPFFCDGVQACLHTGCYELTDEVHTLNLLDQYLTSFPPDLILIGPGWGPYQTLALCRKLYQQSPDFKLGLLTPFSDQFLFQVDAAHAGARASLSSNLEPQTLLSAVATLLNGKRLFSVEILREAEQLIDMTPREIELLREVAQDKTDRQIAHALGISEHTVGVHLRNIFSKIGVHSRNEAVRRARHRGWM